jgi:hypothetical protein
VLILEMWNVDCGLLGGDPAFAGHDKRSVSVNIVGVQAEEVSRWSCEEVSPSVLCTVHQYLVGGEIENGSVGNGSLMAAVVSQSALTVRLKRYRLLMPRKPIFFTVLGEQRQKSAPQNTSVRRTIST